jgi:quinol monooxygenase YgiN
MKELYAMSESIFWIVDGMIKQGAGDDLKSLIDEMISSTEANEPGTVAYEWYMDAGKTRCHIFERYRDSQAAMIHLRTFDQMFAARLGRLLQIERVTLFGNASQEMLNTLGHEGTLALLPLAGFTR